MHKSISHQGSFDEGNQLPPIAYHDRKWSPYHCDKKYLMIKQSDFIRNMKRAQSIIIAHKNRKQKNAMKSVIMDSLARKKQFPILHNSAHKRQSSFRGNTKTQPCSSTLNLESINVSILSKCVRNNGQSPESLGINQMELNSYDQISIKQRPQSDRPDPVQIKREIRNSNVENRPKKTYRKKQTFKIEQSSTKKVIPKHTYGWKLGRWEVADETLS